ncbi:uncharacterized protein LOC130284944 isoform X2 [Hyla sarda]|uniref:uncharacterized protein LOC130284944 isoform X2 n=1 Tax=Hyla sarda TaxID=327740 RepID=UPI0024C3DA9B|nr:uncharacterized protein LOC130284944 isoform X2 [Hyla sarda]
MKLVGIFSREDESCYRWLVNRVVSWKNVRDVRSVSITNNNEKFREETSKCQFGILYHSKKRGRINVIDVIDSLYDYELQHLNTIYGKKNVLVVIDDLDNSSDEEKYRILSHQPSIQLLAQDLFLFSVADKAALNTLGYQVADDPQRALDEMRKIIEGDKNWSFPDTENPRRGDLRSSSGRCRWSTRPCMVLIIAVIVIVVIVLISVLLTT